MHGAKRIARTLARRSVRATATAIAGLTALWIVHAFALQGLLVPLRVKGGSMAPALVGAHAAANCPRCAFPLAWELKDFPLSDRPAGATGSASVGVHWNPSIVDGGIVCPNCGCPDGASTDVVTTAGDRLLIDRTTTWLRRPQRWQPVALRAPDGSGRLFVKRLVGLPNEAIAIRAGDVWIDGTIARKSLHDLHALAVLVHDDRYRAPDQSIRWQAEDANSRWRTTNAGFVCHASPTIASTEESASRPINWLVYHHRQCWSGSGAQLGPIRDDVPYNQSESRVLNEVRDLLLRFRVRSQGRGELLVRAAAAEEAIVLQVDLGSGQGDVRHNDAVLATFDLGPRPFQQTTTMELALVDHQVLVACDGRELVCQPYRPAAVVIRGVDTPWAIGARTAALDIREVQIWRDVYYCAPRSTVGTQQTASAALRWLLGPEEYFVLGDNSAVSEDSRAWLPEQPVSSHLLVGTVRLWRYDASRGRAVSAASMIEAAAPHRGGQ